MSENKDVVRVGNEVFNITMTQNDMHDMHVREERQKAINRARKATLAKYDFYRVTQQ